jgi:glycosyltransferase involved in cell wall biosynthesis
MGIPRTKMSVIIPWCDRDEVALSLRRNSQWFSRKDIEVVVANCGGDRALLARALAEAEGCRTRVVSISAPVFNKCLALNLGTAASTGSTLVFLDADVILEDDFLQIAETTLDGTAFVTVDRVAETELVAAPALPAGLELAYSVEITVPEGRTVRLETNRVRPQEGTRSGPGLVALERRHFLAVNGMNSALGGWGWEDLDLLARLQFELGLRRVAAGRVFHLSHGEEVWVLGGRSRGDSERSNYFTCLGNYASGHFLGTFREDLATWGEKDGL